jgi:hypothetical protein
MSFSIDEVRSSIRAVVEPVLRWRPRPRDDVVAMASKNIKKPTGTRLCKLTHPLVVSCEVPARRRPDKGQTTEPGVSRRTAMVCSSFRV